MSEITEVDIERFFSNEMDGLIAELQSVLSTLDSAPQIKHVNEIINICEQCKKLPDSQLIFDPFSERLKLEDGKWIEA